MRTLDDNGHGGSSDASAELDFCGFRFSTNALCSSRKLARQEDDRHAEHATSKVEDAGKHYLAEPCPDRARDFSKLVCAWGRGGRVWGNLERYHPGQLGERLHGWLSDAAKAPDAETAIMPAIDKDDDPDDPHIKGLGVSFASKHLRMLRPDRYAVLDSVLEQGLGFALNAKGYALFMRQLLQFQQGDLKKALSQQQPTVAEIELGIFGLVRQHVRSDSTKLLPEPSS